MAHTINEGTSGELELTFATPAGVVITLAQMVTATLSLWDDETGATINSRANQNVKNANHVTITAAGVWTWAIQPADTPILDTSLSLETHVACARVTTATGAVTHRVVIHVRRTCSH